MTKVFIGGSRLIGRLPEAVRDRLDRVIGKALPVVIGDAAGADKAAQRHLHDHAYDRVEVFCSSPGPRNNIGKWPVRDIPVLRGTTGRAFHEAKDRAMAAEAAYGLMIWDGKSVGTAMNIARLLRAKRKVAVYLAPERMFHDFSSEDQWASMISTFDGDLSDAVHERMAHEPPPTPAMQSALTL